MTARIAVVMLLGAVMARSAFLVGFLPAFQPPDENEHFDYVQRLAEEWQLPIQRVHCDGFSPEVSALVASWVDPVRFHPEEPLPPIGRYRALPPTPGARSTPGCGPAAVYAPAYYLSAAAAYAVGYDLPLLGRLLSARIVSCLWSAVAVLAVFVFTRSVLGTNEDGLLVGLAYTLHPQAGMLFSSVNSDALLFASSAATLASIAMVWNKPTSRGALVLLAIVTSFGALSKSTFVLYLPVFGVLAAGALGFRRISSWLRAGIALAPAGILAAAWWLASREVRADFFAGPPLQISLPKFIEVIILNPQRLQMIWIDEYWMAWGWLDTLLSRPWYVAIEAMLVLSAIGVVLGWRSMTDGERAVLVATAAGTAFAAVSLYVLEFSFIRRTSAILIQGRYMFPLLPLHLVAIALGLRRLSARIGAPVDGAWVLPSLLAAVSAAATLRSLVRYYA